jgi:thioredoxin reductase (NADPH)
VPDLDLIVVGAGPAGMSAALWARELKLRFVALEDAARPGGQLHRVYNRVADYPGVAAPHGAALAGLFADHLRSQGVAIRTHSAATRVDAARRAVVADGEELTAAYLLLATGVRRRTLGVPGEAEFAGRGVCPSATRHAEEFRGERVLVVGGGDAALEEALILARVCERVTLVHRGERFRGRPDFRERVAADPRIETITGARLAAIEGGERVERARLSVAGVEREVPVAGVFVCVGVLPNTEVVAGELALDDAGYVPTDSRQRTSADRVYAAGDVCAGSSLTIAAAVGQGAAAVKDISRRIAGM